MNSSGFNKNLLKLPSQQGQKGMVLIIALIIMFSMTLLGVSTMTTTSLEERMAFNFRDRQLAFQSAEAALREGERYVQDNNMDPTKFNNNCNINPGWCNCISGCNVEYWSDATLNVWNNAAKHRSYTTTVSGVASQPKYIIENMGNTCLATQLTCNPSDPVMFRITALGYGTSLKTKVMLQSTYRKD